VCSTALHPNVYCVRCRASSRKRRSYRHTPASCSKAMCLWLGGWARRRNKWGARYCTCVFGQLAIPLPRACAQDEELKTVMPTAVRLYTCALKCPLLSLLAGLERSGHCSCCYLNATNDAAAMSTSALALSTHNVQQLYHLTHRQSSSRVAGTVVHVTWHRFRSLARPPGCRSPEAAEPAISTLFPREIDTNSAKLPGHVQRL
jgi:hypothetical protein